MARQLCQMVSVMDNQKAKCITEIVILKHMFYAGLSKIYLVQTTKRTLYLIFRILKHRFMSIYIKKQTFRHHCVTIM